jgi:hypothetical protein
LRCGGYLHHEVPFHMHMVPHFYRNMRPELVYHVMFPAAGSRLGVLQGGEQAGMRRTSSMIPPVLPRTRIAITPTLAARQQAAGPIRSPLPTVNGRARPPLV